MQKEDKENEGHPLIRCLLMKNSLQESEKTIKIMADKKIKQVNHTTQTTQ